jgi:SAM-dependent methyltransferase
MNEAEWDEHYRARALKIHDERAHQPDELVARVAAKWPASQTKRALDLACGAGSNALWLAETGWDVTAVDRSPAGIALLHTVASQRRLVLNTRVADLEAHAFPIEHGAWDLILMCRYLQRALWEPALLGLAPGGVLIVIALMDHIDTTAPRRFRVQKRELTEYFKNADGWKVLHQNEGRASPEKPAVAEIAILRD